MNQTVNYDLSDVISKGRIIRNFEDSITVHLLGNIKGPVVHFRWDPKDDDFAILEQAYLINMERMDPDD